MIQKLIAEQSAAYDGIFVPGDLVQSPKRQDLTYEVIREEVLPGRSTGDPDDGNHVMDALARLVEDGRLVVREKLQDGRFELIGFEFSTKRVLFNEYLVLLLRFYPKAKGIA